jgi:hypothetical protein
MVREYWGRRRTADVRRLSKLDDDLRRPAGLIAFPLRKKERDTLASANCRSTTESDCGEGRCLAILGNAFLFQIPVVLPAHRVFGEIGPRQRANAAQNLDFFIANQVGVEARALPWR